MLSPNEIALSKGQPTINPKDPRIVRNVMGQATGLWAGATTPKKEATK